MLLLVTVAVAATQPPLGNCTCAVNQNVSSASSYGFGCDVHDLISPDPPSACQRQPMPEWCRREWCWVVRGTCTLDDVVLDDVFNDMEPTSTTAQLDLDLTRSYAACSTLRQSIERATNGYTGRPLRIVSLNNSFGWMGSFLDSAGRVVAPIVFRTFLLDLLERQGLPYVEWLRDELKPWSFAVRC